MKTPEEIRNRLSKLAETSSRADPDLQRFIAAEARLYILQNTEHSSARSGYTEFYKNELERLTTKESLGARIADGILGLVEELEGDEHEN